MAIKLPRTRKEFVSPAGQAALDQAEQVLNALSELRVIVTKNGVRQPPVTVKIAGTTATLEISV